MIECREYAHMFFSFQTEPLTFQTEAKKKSHIFLSQQMLPLNGMLTSCAYPLLFWHKLKKKNTYSLHAAYKFIGATLDLTVKQGHSKIKMGISSN